VSQFRVDIYDLTGTRQAILTDFHWLDYQTRVNYPGGLKFSLAGDNPILASVQSGWRADVWRILPNGVWNRDLIGFIDGLDWVYSDKATVTISASGPLSLLSKRRVAYYANTPDRTAFTAAKAETIAKTLVNYNIGANATVANGRMLDGVNPLISVEADSARGNSLDWFCAWADLLETLQDLALAGGGDFDLVYTGTGFEFRWYDGQLGADRTATQVFTLERGNIAEPVYHLSSAKMSNVVVVGGKGEDAERQVRVVQSSDYSAGEHSEAFLDATDVDTDDGLDDRGKAELEGLKTVREFSFQVLQTASSNFGVDYGLGDLVKAINPMTGQAVTVKVDSAQVSIAENGKLSMGIGIKS
jgi:hypothetical protein